MYGDLNIQLITRGGAYVTGTGLNAGPYSALFAHETCVIASMTCAALTGTLTAITVPAGTCYPFPAPGATALTLTSGKATLINAG